MPLCGAIRTSMVHEVRRHGLQITATAHPLLGFELASLYAGHEQHALSVSMGGERKVNRTGRRIHMQRFMPLVWLLLILLVGGANVRVAADACDKWCGLGGVVDSGTRPSDSCGPGGECKWVECSYTTVPCFWQYGPYSGFNDSCYGWIPCQPL
jgi:hypothetical protein